jgi:hypothetical protein
MECTILAHISTDANAINVQNNHHLHWKETESISAMNNKIELSAVAHGLLLKNKPTRIVPHSHRHGTTSLMASPEATKKKMYTRLILGYVEAHLNEGANPFRSVRTEESPTQQTAEPEQEFHQGSIGETTAPAPDEHV